MPYYTKPSVKHLNLLKQVMARYHSRLADAEVRVDVLIAWGNKDDSGEVASPAVTVNGYPCIAAIRVVGLRDRVAGIGDAMMLLDGDQWDEQSEEEQRAIIDHELTHLELVTDSEGNLKRDDAERPKLRIRKHDMQVGWFHEVARRHEEASIEVRQCRDFLSGDNYRQCYLPGMEPVEA